MASFLFLSARAAFLSSGARSGASLRRSGCRQFLRHSSSLALSVPPDESDCRFQPINVLDKIQGADWNDRIALQENLFTEQAKGWQVHVQWKMTPFGVGLFAAQDIPSGTILRIGSLGHNLMQFRSIDEIEAFCRLEGMGNDDDADYQARLHYVKDYLWGYSPSHTDAQGYDLASSPLGSDDRFYGMWIPGNGLNHSPTPNTVYRTRQGGTDVGIVLVALRDISDGEELFDDYRRHGRAPTWLLEFASSKQVSLNFAECNDFVDVADVPDPKDNR